MKKLAIIYLLLIHVPASHALSWRSVVSAPVRAAKSVGRWCRSHPGDVFYAAVGIAAGFMIGRMIKNYRNRVAVQIQTHPAYTFVRDANGVRFVPHYDNFPPDGILGIPRPPEISERMWFAIILLHLVVLEEPDQSIDQIEVQQILIRDNPDQPIDQNEVQQLEGHLRNAQEPSANAQNDACTICLDPLGERCVVTRCNRDGVPTERHGFHPECLAPWFVQEGHRQCPNCQANNSVTLVPEAPIN